MCSYHDTGGKVKKMQGIHGQNLIVLLCVFVLFGWYIFPGAAALCDGPPKSQSLILFSGGCDRTLPGLPCTQGFMFPAQPSPGGDFPTQYSLDFGDGSPPYVGPFDGVTHTYRDPGLFTLKFMAGTQCDLWRQDTFTLNISVPENYTPAIPACSPILPVAGFTSTPTSGVAPLAVRFTSTSANSNAYSWSFGDGGTSPAQNPLHTYVTPGTYSVSLVARDSCSGAASSSGMSTPIIVSEPVATLSVTSTPPGATIFIDNVMRGVTPATFSDSVTGSHILTIRKEGYEEYTKNILVEPASPVTIVAGLSKSVSGQASPVPPATGSIAITSVPSGAVVTLDGRMRDVTPVSIADIVPGNHEIMLSLKGYDDWIGILAVGSGHTSEINAFLVVSKEPLNDAGSVAVATDPGGADIYIDGVFKGVSPVTVPGLSNGTHLILVTLKEYENISANITITGGQTQKFTPGLQKMFRLSTIDLLLAVGAFVMVVVIALVVMFRKVPGK